MAYPQLSGFGGPVPGEFGPPGPPFFPGFGGAGAGGGLNFDIGAGAGVAPGILGGIPGFAGFGGPYVPVTPLGALGGIKGDLIVPMVAIGVAIFLLVIIVLAVKAALVWKLNILSDIAGGPRRVRDVDGAAAPAPQLETESMAHMTNMILSAIGSQICAERLLCEVACLYPDKMPPALRLMEAVVPSDYIKSLEFMRKCAEEGCSCAEKYRCSASGNNHSKQQDQPGSMGSPSTPSKDMKMQTVDSQAMQMNDTMQMDKNSMDVTTDPMGMQMNEEKDDKAEQKKPKFGQFAQNQVPLPMQQATSPRPTLLDGIQDTKNQSDAVLTNEVRPSGINKGNKFRRNISKK